MATGSDLMKSLNDVEASAEGVFGICYSVLTWTGTAKGVSLDPSTWFKPVRRLIEDGHGITFLIVKNANELTTTGMDSKEKGWVFDTGPIGTTDWARSTPSTTTYVYYIGVDKGFLINYDKVKAKLKGKKATYAVVTPNLGYTETRYENCVSHCHYLMWELGLGNWIYHNVIFGKGWWVPSVSNWADWFMSFLPAAHGNFKWRFKSFPNTNTYLG